MLELKIYQSVEGLELKVYQGVEVRVENLLGCRGWG